MVENASKSGEREKAWEEYKKVEAAAWKEYQKAKAAALEE